MESSSVSKSGLTMNSNQRSVLNRAIAQPKVRHCPISPEKVGHAQTQAQRGFETICLTCLTSLVRTRAYGRAYTYAPRHARARAGTLGRLGNYIYLYIYQLLGVTYLFTILPIVGFLEMAKKCDLCIRRGFTYDFSFHCCRVRFLLVLPNAKAGRSWRKPWAERWASQHGKAGQHSVAVAARMVRITTRTTKEQTNGQALGKPSC